MHALRLQVPVLLLVVCALALGLAACGGGTSAAPPAAPPTTPNQSGLNPTTTLAIETGNNTSAADSFVAQTNGNAGAGSVSKIDTHSLLYPGASTKIFAHMVGWFGGSNHIDVGYHSDDPAQVHRQVEDMISRGIQGAVMDWFGQGPSGAIVAGATAALKTEAEAHPGFQFAIMEDVGALVSAAIASGCDVTDQLISDLNFVASQYENSPAYLHMNGRPVVLFFGVNAFYIDWNRALASIAGNPILLFRGGDGFNLTYADGGFQWEDINSANPFDQELAAQDAFYTTATSSSRISFGSAYKGFNDTLARWSTNRFVYQGCGQTWLATFSEIGKFFSSSNQLATMQLVTWNDYEEGTAIEMGIGNCVAVVPSTSGTVLNWNIAGGSENTIDHYTVFASTDGQNLTKLKDVPAGTHSFDLSGANLPSGTVTLFVKAVGRPSIQNKMSPAIAFHAGDQPPVAALALSQTGPLTFAASTSASSDADGSIANSTIDFGDGTVASGPNASHTYAVAGTYTVTATVVDNAGASAVAIQTFSAKPSSPGVTIAAPAIGAIVNWPGSIVQASAAGNVTGMNVYVDSQLTFMTNKDTINTTLKIFRGTHHLVVQAFDTSGGSTTAAADISAEPTDLSPTAILTVQPLPSAGTGAVLACSEGSTDPDGFVLTDQIQFSDGKTFFTPAAVDSFAPGSYSATVSLIDEFGAPGSASQTFSVGGTTAAVAPAAPLAVSAIQMKKAEPIRQP